MNLRKMSKTALIAEVRRLRKIEILGRQCLAEIKRRNEATAHYEEIEPIAVFWAGQIANKPKIEQNALWEKIWPIIHKRFSDFWDERCADLIDKYSKYIEGKPPYIYPVYVAQDYQG